jgi:hypothetical protein
LATDKTKPWIAQVRWQDWINALLGIWLVVSPWELGYTLDKAATGNACGVGVVLAAFNLISACRLLDEGQEIFNLLLGGWLVLSPYSLSFDADSKPTTNAIAAGTLVIGLAALGIWREIRKNSN